MSIDASPERLRELADAALCSTAFVPKELLLVLADEKEAQPSPVDVPLPEDTVSWPTVTRYSGGASPEGLGGRVWVRLKDDGLDVEYMPVVSAAQQVTDVTLPEPLFLLHCDDEPGEWDIEADSGRVVEELAAKNPGKTLDLITADAARQYAQDCAKAARDAAFDEGIKAIAAEIDLEALRDSDSFYRGMSRAVDVLQTAKKGTT